MNIINPFPHASPIPGPMGNQTLSRLSDFFQNPAPSFVLIASGCRILIASAFGILCRGVSKTSSGSRSCRCSLPELSLPRPSPCRCRSPPSIRAASAPPSCIWPQGLETLLLFCFGKTPFIPASERELSASKMHVREQFVFAVVFLL